MLKSTLAALVILTATAPAFAAVDRATAVAALAGFYHSASVCNLFISRAKIDEYAEANRPADDALFNVDVFRATQALYTAHEADTEEQTKAYCAEAADAARKAGVNLN